MLNFAVNIVQIYGLGLLNARTFAGTVMTKVGSCVHMEGGNQLVVIEGLEATIISIQFWYLNLLIAGEHQHYGDVIMSTIASQITSVSIVYSTVCVQAEIKENIKAPRHWPLFRNSPKTGEFPAQRASNAEKVSIWWRHHGEKSDFPSLPPDQW